jgi:hypothetical protein
MIRSEFKAQTSWRLLAILIAGALLVGCSRQSGRDGLAPVFGRVTYAGQPLAEGRILFYPDDGRRMAMGSIDASGNYALTTFEHQDGAYVGKHRVVIEAVREISLGPKSPDDEYRTGNVRRERLVPAIYADRKSSPLEAVVEDRNNTINFDIPQ